MNAKALKQTLSEIVLKTNIVPFIWGEKGIGKSQIVHQLAVENNLEIHDLRLGQMEIGDLIGIPYHENGRTYWAKPSWFPEDGSGIIFLDELNRAQQQDTLQAIFQFILDKKLHTHMLPEGWKIVCAGNPPGGDYIVAELDPALMDRFVHLIFTPDTVEWLGWAKSKGIKKDISEFISVNQNLLMGQGNHIDLGIKPTPRSYEMLSIIMEHCHLPKSLFLEVAAGLIGKEASVVFGKFLEEHFDRPVSAEEVMHSYSKVRDKVKKSKIDMLNATIDQVVVFCQEENKINYSHLEQFILDLPQDIKFACVKRLVQIDSVSEKLGKSDKLYKVMKKITQKAEA